MTKKFFITATGTGVGKTLVTASLCWQLGGENVTALKPVISGYDPDDLANDSAQILISCGREPTAAEQACISPWRYSAPLAPNMAAAREGNPVDFEQLITFCTTNRQPPTTLIEGVGGIMSPITDQHTVLDWMTALHWPVILVAGSYLGAISHTLSAVAALQAKTLAIHALIISESEGSGVSLEETAATVERFLPDFPIVKIPRLGTTESAWKETPSISWLCQDHPN